MPLDQDTLKQLRNGTLETLSVQTLAQNARHMVDDKEWKVVKNLIATSTSLKEIDFTNMHGQFEQLADALKRSTSLRKLNLTAVMSQHSLPQLASVLKDNPQIREIVLDDCHFYSEADGGNANLRRMFETSTNLTHVSLEVHQPQVVHALARTIAKSVNILSFSPEDGSGLIRKVCDANKMVAAALAISAKDAPEKLTAKEIADISERLPSVMHMLETKHNLDRKAMAQIFLCIEDRAQTLGVSFDMPRTHKEIADWMPLPFYPSSLKVVFNAHTTPDAATLYKAAEAGQMEELFAAVKNHGKKLTAQDYLFKPDGKSMNLIELIARQSKLADVMDVANWTGDPRGMRAVAATVPAREWRRQMKDTPIDRLVSQVNAATLKNKRPKTGPTAG